MQDIANVLNDAWFMRIVCMLDVSMHESVMFHAWK